MIPNAGVVQSIDANLVDIDDSWLWSTEDIWSQDYAQVLVQPISLEANDLSELRFKAAQTTLTIRATTDPLSQVLWSGVVNTVDDPVPAARTDGTVTSVDLQAPALMTASGGPVTSSGTLALEWSGSDLDLVLADGTTFALADIVTPPHNSLTGRGVADAHPMSAITGLVSTFGHYLPLAAGPSSPLAGTLHGTSLYFSGWTADAPIVVAMNYSSAFAHAITVVNFGLTAGQRLTVDFGQSAYTNNQANFGFVYAGAGSTANKITLGLYGNNDLVTIAGTGVVTVRDLGTGFVRATSGVLSASALAGADLPNSGVTAATYGSATQSAVVVVDAKGRITSASNITITPAFASITGKPTTLAGYGITDATLQNAYNASTVGATTPQILTSAAKGALYIRRGSAADTDNVFVIENGSGSDQFLVTGNGDVTARRLVLTKDSPTYTDSAALELASNTPRIRLFDISAGGANQQGWEITCAGTYLSWDSLTDAGDVAGVMLAATKAPDGRLASVAIGGGGYLNGGLIINNSTGIATVLGGYSTQFGTAAQFLKADGSLDSTAYAPAFGSGAAGLVWATPAATAGVPSLRALAASDIPTLNQNTTGSSAKWTTARTLTIGATGKSVDGSANVSWSLGEIGALPLAGGVMNSGAQILTNKDITPSASPNTNYAAAPLVAQRASGSGTTTVAAVGFHNLGVNAAALYYDAAASVFRYNRHTGDIVTLWDNSNLTPAAIGAATTTHAATHHAGGSDQITGQSLSGLRTTDSPTFAGLKLGSSGGAAPSANTPLVVRNASGASIARVESGTTGVAVSQWANTDASWSFGVRSDAASGSPVGALVAADATSARMWVTSTGVVVPGQISAGSAILKTYSDPNYFSLWGDGASAPNYTLAGSRNGAEAYLNGSSKVSLCVHAQEKVIATATGVSIPVAVTAASTLAWGGGGAIGSSANVVQGENSTRTIETAAWTSALPSGFYVSSSAGTTPSGGWCHMIAGRYTDPNANYQSQIATDFWNDRVWFRRIENGSVKDWREFWHSGNLNIRDYTGSSAYTAYYPSGVTPSNTNFAFAVAKDDTYFVTNASTQIICRIGVTDRFVVSSTGAYVGGSLSVTHDTSTTSLTITGSNDNGGPNLPAGYSQITINNGGTSILPAPVLGRFLLVTRITSSPVVCYVKPAASTTIAYMDLGGVARILTNSAANGLNIGAVGSSMMFVGASSTQWGLIGAWPVAT